MSVYAPVPAYADRRRHPATLLLIVGAHAFLLAAVMTAKMDLAPTWDPTKTKVTLVPLPPDPPQSQPQPKPQPPRSVIDHVPRVVPLPQPPEVTIVDRTPLPMPNPGPAIDGQRSNTDAIPAPVRTGPRFVTPEADVRPPYPQQKLRLEEEAVLRLRLAIDERGRVTAVEPVGSADPVFLTAARRHLISRWRYQPATEGGRAVVSSTVITLRFQLND